jgi:PAS domain S-box-containing protein
MDVVDADASASGAGDAAHEPLAFQDASGCPTGGCSESPAFPPIHEAGLSFLCEGLPGALHLGAGTPLHASPSAALGLSVPPGPHQRRVEFPAPAAGASACSGRSSGSGRASAGSGRSSRVSSASAAAAAGVAASERAAHYATLRSDAASSAGTVPLATEVTDHGAAARGSRSGSADEAAITQAAMDCGSHTGVKGPGAALVPVPAPTAASFAQTATGLHPVNGAHPATVVVGVGPAGFSSGSSHEPPVGSVTLEGEGSRIRTTDAVAGGGKAVADSSSDAPAAASAAVSASALPAVDLALVRALDRCHTSFTISDPSLPDNPLVFASDGFLALSGYSHAEVLGRNCRLLQGPGTDRATVARISAALQAGRSVTAYLLNYRKDGLPFWCYLSISPLRDTEGRIRSFVGVQARADAVPERPLPQRPVLRDATASDGRAGLGAHAPALSAASGAAAPLAPSAADATAAAAGAGVRQLAHQQAPWSERDQLAR